jgi:hypothetical protein
MAKKHPFANKAARRNCDLDLTFKGHRRSNIMMGKESSHMTSYQNIIIVTQWLECTGLKIQQPEDIVTWI